MFEFSMMAMIFSGSQTLHSQIFGLPHHFHDFSIIFQPLEVVVVVQITFELIQMDLNLLSLNWFKPVLENHI